MTWPGPRAWLAVAAFVALLLLAPARSNVFWAVNALRSLPPAAGALLVVAALLAGTIPLARSRAPFGVALGAAALMMLVAFPLRERIHFLGDTATRIGALAIYVLKIEPKPLAEWARQIHAEPIDFLANFLVPAGLMRLGMRLEVTRSLVSFALGLCFVAGAWRAVSRLSPPPETRVALFAAVALSGLLEAFAGYTESAGVVLVTAAWWWAALLAPMRTRRDAALVLVAWLGLLLAHRVGAVMLLPQLWRAVGPARPGDETPARRTLLAGSVAAVAVAVLFLFATGAAPLIARDVTELLSSLTSRGGQLAPPSDVANLFVLIAPLALLAPLLAGVEGLRGFARRPEAGLILVAALPLVPIAIQVGASGLGLHRDWDLDALLGWTLTLGGAAAMSRQPAPTLRGALALGLPVLALVSLGWVAVNASESASVARAEALAAGPPALAPSQRAQVLLFLGGWSMKQDRARQAAGYYERSYDHAPTPNRGLLAARSWMMAGDIAAAERMLARVRAGGGFDARSHELADSLEHQIARRARAGTGGGP